MSRWDHCSSECWMSCLRSTISGKQPTRELSLLTCCCGEVPRLSQLISHPTQSCKTSKAVTYPGSSLFLPGDAQWSPQFTLQGLSLASLWDDTRNFLPLLTVSLWTVTMLKLSCSLVTTSCASAHIPPSSHAFLRTAACPSRQSLLPWGGGFETVPR